MSIGGVDCRTRRVLREETAMILVVDDETIILDVSTRVLEMHGFKVLTAESVKGALDVAQEHSGDIRLAIVDIGLPDGEGWKVCEGLWALNPDITVFMSSGNPVTEFPSWLNIPPNRLDTIDKPYGMKELVDKVRPVMEA